MMITISGYKTKEQLYESSNSIVFRATREADNKSVILKMLNQEYPTPDQLAKFKREYEMTQNLKIDGVIQIHNLEKYKNTLLMVIEDFGGESLTRLTRGLNSGLRELDIKEFLRLAIRIVEILGQVHQAHIIHKDINPSNIVWNRKTDVVKLIDFGISTELSREVQSVLNPNVLEGTLRYMSPEQTGRMNRAMDYRTDFYSLGISFYEILTGKLPFSSTDSMELVHSHIAKIPVAPLLDSGLQPTAQVLSQIIMKLISKTAEERYQSAAGLVYDLECCLNPVGGVGDDFQIGTHDISEKFRIPQKLYGRDLENSILFDLFKIACIGDGASLQFALVSGSSGIGKTALIHEIQKPIVSEKGYFLEGKYDKFKRNIPYRAIINAFQDLTRQILSESEEKISVWRKEILDALGANGKVMTEVIPELEAIIGEQAAVMELGQSETHNRFNLVFQNFIGVFCKAEHPLVIFLDDLQWADLPSLQLLKSILTGSFQFIFFMFSFRSNEVDSVHPFSTMLEEVEKAGREGTSIYLEPLKEAHVAELVADTLKQPVDSVRELASILHSKTQGNPFFVNELFTSFYKDGFVYLDKTVGSYPLSWNWDISKISAANISANVIEHTVNKIHKLPEDKIELLKLAACVGNTLSLDAFLKMNDASEEDTLESIQYLANERYFLFSKKEVRFIHDKILESVYILLTEEERAANHYKIGKLYLSLADTGEYVLEDRIFSIVNQLNQGINVAREGRDPPLLQRLVDLNVLAGDKAIASSAYESGLIYFTTAQSLLPENSWEVNYDKSLNIYTKLARLEYLNGNYEKAEELFEIILGIVKTDLEKVSVYEIKIIMYLAQLEFRRALDIGLKALEILGDTFPEVHNPSAEFGKIFQLLGKKKPEDLLHIPLTTEPYNFAAMRLLVSCIIPTFVSMPSLFPLIIGRMVAKSLEFGNFPLSPVGYVWFGNIVGSGIGNYDLGYGFGELAKEMIVKYSLDQLKCSVYWVFYVTINHWKNHPRISFPLLLEGFQSGVSFGDIQFASYSINQLNYQRFFIRENLEELNTQLTENYKSFENLNQQDTNLQYSLNWQMVLNLLGESKNLFTLKGDKFNETEIIENLKLANNFSALFIYYYNKSILFYLFGDSLNAYKYSKEASQHESSHPGVMSVPEHVFFDSLTCLTLTSPIGRGESGEVYIKQITKNQERMKVWAENCPANYGHKYYIVEGALADIEGEDWKAIQFFRKAIELAKEHEYTLEEAIANELFANFWSKRGEEGYAKANLTYAHYAYTKWGCVPKVKMMEQKHPFLAQTKTRKSFTNTTTTDTSTTELLDLESVLKVSHAISGEIVLETLLKKMIKLLIENAGAQRGILLLQDSGEWKIEASGSVEEREAKVLESILLDGGQEGKRILSPAIVHYVEKTKEALVLEDATHSGMFTKDSYIQSYQPKSVLCAPILHQSRLTGIIYLENNLTTGAFTSDRLEIISLLSSQTAISLENASLYANLEEKIVGRTIQLKQAHEKILALEKEANEKQLAGGFAHEIRNALVGPKLVIQHALGEDGKKPYESIGVTNTRKLKEIYLLIKDTVSADTLQNTLKAMKVIFENAEQIDNSLKLIYKAVSKGLNITHLIMDYAKVGNEQANKSQVDLNILLKNLVEEYKKEWLEHKISIHLDLTKEYSQIQGLETHLESVYKNLLLNAKDALLDNNRSNGKDKSIKVKTKVEGNLFLTEITDNGSGISPEHLDKIYDAFFSTKPESGTGLGLGVVKKIITLYNGNIEANSELGKGTTFTVALPLGREK